MRRREIGIRTFQMGWGGGGKERASKEGRGKQAEAVCAVLCCAGRDLLKMPRRRRQKKKNRAGSRTTTNRLTDGRADGVID